MKTLHHVSIPTGSIQLVPTPAAGTVLAYVNVTRYLSEKLGRNLPQAQCYRMVGFRATLVNYSDAAGDINASVAMQLRSLTPTRARVAAHEDVMREYVADVRDDMGTSIGRQLITAYDGTMPVDPAESVLLRGDVPNRVVLLGASSAGVVGVFADYNARNPKKEGVAATLYQPDQDLYTVPASMTEDTINGHATLYGAWHEDAELPLDVPTAYGPWNGPVTVHDWQWWAPAGTFVPLMCGFVKIIYADSFFPFLQSGPGAIVNAVTPVRGTMLLLFDMWIEGWTPLSRL